MELMRFTLATILVVLVFYLLVVGQALLLPLVIAIVFWYLINVLASGFARLRVAGYRLPWFLCLIASILTFLAITSVLVQFVGASLNDLGTVTRQYEANIRAHWQALPFADYLPTEGLEQLVSDRIDISAIFTSMALSFTSLVADGGLILIYVGFLLFEQGNFNRKLSALIGSDEHEKKVLRIIARIRADIQKYIGIKVLTSSLTALLSYALLRLLDINFAEVWALLIFLLNFIPTIGSIIATIFPAMIALAQSAEGIGLFLIVLISIGALQVCIGNILEPRLMGSSFNLSPIVILFNLALWGSIWGVAGMFLCVPFLIIITIILAHFPRTRPIAVMLSSDGRVDFAED